MISCTTHGFVSTEPVERSTTNGNKLTSCSLAVQMRNKQTEFVSLTFWHSETSLNALQYIKKGSGLVVSGELYLSRKGESTYVNLDVKSFSFLSTGSNSNGKSKTQSPEVTTKATKTIPTPALENSIEDEIPF
jgi:single-stranded DNA-binding protein